MDQWQLCSFDPSANISRRTGTWNDDLADKQGVSRSCDDVIAELDDSEDDDEEGTPEGQIIDQNANNFWFLPGDGTRTWINDSCATSLQELGINRRAGSWNDDLADKHGVSRTCSVLLSAL